VALSKRLIPQNEELWPNLVSEGYEVKSIQTWRYNCIAFAADDPSLTWWPSPQEDVYWPIERREVSLACFVEAFESIGYQKCEAGLESGFEKVAIYMFEGEPSHAAKQLPDGRWKSKLGGLEDIEHNTVKAVEDDCCYGRAVQYMKRPIK
jgi:hypothetical protein